jgi:hypothetical protein
VVVEGRGFWALDDALAVCLAYLVDEIGRRDLEVADGFVALLDGTLPTDPPPRLSASPCLTHRVARHKRVCPPVRS